VVTGAGHGIGLGIATALRDAGATVCGVEIDPDRAQLLRQSGFSVVEKSIARGAAAADAVLQELGEIPTLIINNAAVRDGRSFLELSRASLEQTMAVNLTGPWEFSQILAKEIIASSQPAAFLFILSLHTQEIRMSPDYSASKAALGMLVKEMADVLGPHSIRVNGLSPGAVDTWSDDPGKVQRTDAMFPLRRIGQVADIVPMAMALLDDKITGYVTGADFVVDGGLAQYNWLHAIYGTAEEERRQKGH
jgi:3-oxoacyl-[acyl-carrier protein] reductase